MTDAFDAPVDPTGDGLADDEGLAKDAATSTSPVLADVPIE
jgi:hypothetical protein